MLERPGEAFLAFAQRFFRALVFDDFCLKRLVALLQLAGPPDNQILQLLHFSPGLLVQPPFFRERVRQLERFHRVKRLFENE